MNLNRITTITGRQFDLCSPDPQTVDLFDIAFALSMLCRYTGHVRGFYSVAQHCVIASELAEPADQLVALFHDGAEAYTGDINRKVKAALGRTFAMFEANIEQAVAERLGLPWPMQERIREIDDRLIVTEHRDLRNGPLEWHDPRQTPPPPFDHIKIEPLPQKKALKAFLDRFHALTGSSVLNFDTFPRRRPE